MIGLDRCPRLNTKARLRYDRHSGEHVLLYPERGLVLSASAAELVALCDGTRTVAAIAERLSVRFSPRPPAEVMKQVRTFLGALVMRGVLHTAPTPSPSPAARTSSPPTSGCA